MNRLYLLGRLTADVETKTAKSGQTVARFRLAVNRPPVNGQKATDFFGVVVFVAQADACGKYIGKGTQVLVEGHLATSEYTDQGGQKRRSMEIIADRVHFLSRPGGQPVATSVPAETAVAASDWTEPVGYSDIPF